MDADCTLTETAWLNAVFKSWVVWYVFSVPSACYNTVIWRIAGCFAQKAKRIHALWWEILNGVCTQIFVAICVEQPAILCRCAHESAAITCGVREHWTLMSFSPIGMTAL
jgi:hypothetical protein